MNMHEPTHRDEPMTNDAYAALELMARHAVDGIPFDVFAEMYSDDLDAVHEEVFAEALEAVRFDAYGAADISDAIHEGLSIAYYKRHDQLTEDGLI